LPHYATQLSTVEIDATWHAVPGRATWEGWERKVPPGFRFALKAPRSITHDKALRDCEPEWERFWALTELLGPKRGPVLFQFPYVAKKKDPEEYRTGARFRARLEAFARQLPAEGRFVVEVRNATWIAPPLLDLLRQHGIALALTAYYTMPKAREIRDRLTRAASDSPGSPASSAASDSPGSPASSAAPDPPASPASSAAPDPPASPASPDVPGNDLVTAPFAYVRFLGHHRRMDQRVARARQERGKTRDWDELLVDRTEETRAWVPVLRELLARTGRVYVYYNNHYAGYAPGSIALLSRVWNED
jgi:uncharacterized protein YecE (DUF72 family)